ncbi:MAG: Fe-S protein assembly co-chaperone HscB [Saprospiraceae bacterium]
MSTEDYFLYFGIPRKYAIDQAELRKKYYALSRTLHPDLSTSYSEADDHRRISHHNNAYKTLSDPILRLRHLLELEGVTALLEKQPSSAFLFEMMEIGEEISELASDQGKKTELEGRLQRMKQESDEKALKAVYRYDLGEGDAITLEQLADWYIQQRYLRRLTMTLRGSEEM